MNRQCDEIFDTRALMEETKSLESRLHSWQPRRPSAGLKRRVFAEPISFMPKMAWLAGWLVPATACALLTFSVFTAGNGISERSSSREPMMATILSNRSYLVPAPDMLPQGQNELSSVTFDLTNRSGPTSSIVAFPHSRVN